MKKILAFCTLAFASVRLLALPTYDYFNYTAGDALVGKTNQDGLAWVGLNATATPAGGQAVTMQAPPSGTFVPTGLPGGFPTPTSNAIQLTGAIPSNNGQGALLTNNVVSNGVVYASFFMHVTATNNWTGAGGTSGAFFAAFSSASTTDGGVASSSGRLQCRRNITGGNNGFQLGLTKTSGSATDWVFDPTVRSTNDTLFVVMGYDFSASENIVSLWVNPASTDFGAAAAPTPTIARTTNGLGVSGNIAAVRSFGFLNRSTGVNTLLPTSLWVDDLHVGTSWSYVTGGPDVRIQPKSVAATGGSTVLFTNSAITIAGAPTVNYAWKKGGVFLSNGGNISGSASSVLTVSSVSSADVGAYTCVASNSIGNIESTNALLSVDDPLITTQPVAFQSLPPGATANFNLSAVGSPPLTYQWSNGAGPLADDGTRIFGAASTNLTILNVSAGDSGSYTCTVSGSSGSRTSTASVLSVSDPAITVGPTNRTANFGTTTVFNVTAAGTGSFTYQWQLNGNNLSDGGPTGGGATLSGSSSAALSIAGVSLTDAGSYTVVVTGAGTVTSSPAVLTVNEPIFVTQPTNVTVVAGDQAVFSVTTAGNQGVFYQWRKGTTVLADTANIVGTDGPSMTILNCQAANAGSYNCKIAYDVTTNFISSSATLTVITPTTVVSSPLNRYQRVGENTAFAVGAIGNSLTYSWTKDGGSVIGTGPAIVLTNIQTSDAGTYQVAVGGLTGTITVSATLGVATNLIHLATNRLVVSRVGDGAQVLSRATTLSGNTLYLDQFDTSGNYFATTMIPDDTNKTSQALIVNGQDTSSGAVGLGESILGVSPNNRFLGFGGYNVSRPYTNNAIDAVSSSIVPRCGGVVNGLGYYAMTWRSTTAFSGAAVRSFMPDSSGTNFWSANGTGVRYVGGNSNIIIDASTAVANNRVIQGFTVNGNYNLYVGSASSTNSGIYKVSGTPTATNAFSLLFTNNGVNLNNEFSISPDGRTVYIAQGQINANTGALARYDSPDGVSSWTQTYSFTAPSRGLLVDWSGFSGGGSSGAGAVLYATTAETNNNKLITIVDTGSSSVITTLASAGTNAIFRSVRFGPPADPASVAVQPQNVNANSGDTATLSFTPGGSAPFTYQWLSGVTPLAGATNATLVFTNAQITNSGSYSVIVSNDLGSATSSSATLTVVNANPPTLGISPAGSNVILSWPASYTGFTLEGTTNFTDGWSPAGTGGVNGGFNLVTNPMTGHKFYRLRK